MTMSNPPTRQDRSTHPLVSLSDIEAAAERISSRVIQTPLLTNQSIDRAVSLAIGGNEDIDVRIAFKAEHLQVVGAFKSRGAANAIQVQLAQLKQDNPNFDSKNLCVLTHSSGNHGAALACQAKNAGVQAAIVMPRTAPQVKKDNVSSYGARIWYCEPRQEARDSKADEVRGILESEGLIVQFIHPYDDPAIIAGQGTMGREMMMQAKSFERRGGCSHAAATQPAPSSSSWNTRSSTDTPLDIVIAPVGGGGMLSGVSSAVKGMDDRVLVIGAEPSKADDARKSYLSGTLHPAIAPPQTICDGLLTSLSEQTLAHIERRVDLIALAEESAIVGALKMVAGNMKQIIEPSAAVGLATLLEAEEVKEMVRKVAQRRKNTDDPSVRVGVVWSGGNVTVETLAEYLTGQKTTS